MDVYSRTCSQLIPSVIQGYNACVFAYGTTGSGKTFTMTGTVDHPGIMVLILKDLFNAIQHSKIDSAFTTHNSFICAVCARLHILYHIYYAKHLTI